jgi:hypothetical protein
MFGGGGIAPVGVPGTKLPGSCHDFGRLLL